MHIRNCGKSCYIFHGTFPQSLWLQTIDKSGNRFPHTLYFRKLRGVPQGSIVYPYLFKEQTCMSQFLSGSDTLYIRFFPAVRLSVHPSLKKYQKITLVPKVLEQRYLIHWLKIFWELLFNFDWLVSNSSTNNSIYRLI